jgi:U3 small nucleolar RNA-associated protein 18
MLTCGYDKALRLFQIDGKDNPKLQSIVLKDLPISNANFSANGLQVILTGRRNYFYVYDLENGSVERICGIRGRSETSFEKSYVSPCNKYVVILGRDGYIILLSMLTKQWIADLKMTGEVTDVCFSSDGKYLFSIGTDAQVYKWDLDSRECVHRFNDHGSIKPGKIAVSLNGEWLATGANTGVVNLYAMDRCMASENPEPEKAVMNILSPISTLVFHPSSQLLAFGSNEMVDAMRLLHVPSLRVVKNWPTSNTPLNFVWSIDFSKDGKFIAIGNGKGKVLLYRFRAF